ncbi:MAG TPA: hypothetical protein VN030_09095 [Cellvibrio sp.]|nr:hypothetical protein [Cellvibrio sp.]
MAERTFYPLALLIPNITGYTARLPVPQEKIDWHQSGESGVTAPAGLPVRFFPLTIRI